MPDSTGLPFGDTADFEAAERGLVDAGDPVVRNEAGEVVWDNGSYSFLAGDAPETVHPSLWRQSTLVAPDHGTSYRTTLHNGVLTYVKDSDKPADLTLTVPAAALPALAQGNMDAARSNGLTVEGDQSQLASLFSVLQPGDPRFNIVEP